jgi:hypothetical protein
LDEKNNAFKVSGLPAGTYILEATGQFDDRKQHRATKTVVVGDTDVLGIVLEPSSLAEITGRVTVEGHAATRGVVSSIMLQAAGSSTNAQLDEDGSFRFNDLVPNSYRLVAIPAGSYYVRSILYGGRDARSDDLVLGALPPGPIEIDLGSHGATIQGQLAVPASDLPAPIAIALFRRAGERAVLEKLAYINGSLSQASAMAATLPATVIGQFTMQGVAPGEYVLFAWPADTQIEYAEPGFLRQFESQGVAVRAIEDGVVNVSVEHFPKVER